MFKNYVLIALRNLKKNKLYALINVFGLAIGLAFYLFGGILSDYEYNHDSMWMNEKRIYSVGSNLQPDANIGLKEMDTTYTAMGPLIANYMADDVEAVARTVRRGYVVSHADKVFNETIRFTDPDLLKIFDFKYLYGDIRALNESKSAVISRKLAEKMFGSVEAAQNKVLLLDSKHDVTVRAVIEDLPPDTHFNSSFIDSDGYDIFIPLTVLSAIADWDIKGNWDNLSMGNHIYVMTKTPMDTNELRRKVNDVYFNHTTEESRQGFMKDLKIRQIRAVNTAIWDSIGMPAIMVVRLLSIFVLVIAIVNYANLSAAQSMGRVREVGMRKTLGAGQGQLLSQFLVESVTIAALAMVLSLVCLELIIPAFNNATGKVVQIHYYAIAGWLLSTTVVVGLVSGMYPAYLITKVNPITALKQMTMKGSGGTLFRSILIGFQFVLSIIILGVVLVMYFQNQKMVKDSETFPKDDVLTITGLNKQAIRDKQEVLRTELKKIPHVSNVTFAQQVPFEQSNSMRSVSLIDGDKDHRVSINVLPMDEEFLPTFDFKLLAGRNFSREVSADYRKSIDDRNTNVIVNELLLKKLNLGSPQEAIGKSFYGTPGEKATFRYDIIGVVENKKILGAHNEMKAWAFHIDWYPHFYGAIRIKKGSPKTVVSEIEDTWKKILPEFPMERRYLGEIFDMIFSIFNTMNMAIGGFALVALMLALFGLFGLAAFMARGRTKEMGIRKVLGAERGQLIRLLLWQFSKPVMWAILLALPLALLASFGYLQMFSDRLDIKMEMVPLVLLAGFMAVLFSWGVVTLHAVKVVNANPIKALRYE